MLNQVLVDISFVLAEKRKCYYKKHLDGSKLENIVVPTIFILEHTDGEEYFTDDEE